MTQHNKHNTLTIVARRDGFRRCGVAHSSSPTHWQLDAFSAAEWQQLRAEPMLTVFSTQDDHSLTLERALQAEVNQLTAALAVEKQQSVQLEAERLAESQRLQQEMATLTAALAAEQQQVAQLQAERAAAESEGKKK